ncbi:MAG: hypothetical protein ACI4P0_06100, partial [Mailhella sp.]
KITVHVSSSCMKILDDGVEVNTPEGKKKIEADAVVLCAGMRALAEKSAMFDDLAFDVIHVGDCKKVGTVADATASGYDAALVL